MLNYLHTKGLSPSEIGVVSYVMKGLSNKEVGNLLGVKDKTVKFHLTNVYKKTGYKNRAMLIASLYALENGGL